MKTPALTLLGCLLTVTIATEASAQKIYGTDDVGYVTSSRDPAVIGYVICLQDAVSATPRSVSMADALSRAVNSCQRWARRLPNTRGEPDAGEILQSIRECGFRPGDASPDAGCGRQANAGGNRGPRQPVPAAEHVVLTPTVIPLGQNVEGIAFDGKWLWAAESGQRTIARIDLARGAVVERVKVGRLPVTWPRPATATSSRWFRPTTPSGGRGQVADRCSHMCPIARTAWSPMGKTFGC